jgi:hypothetical protein
MAAHNRKAQKHRAMAQIRAVEAVLRRWDPIGFGPGVGVPADEYDGYGPHIVTIALAGASAHDVALHLSKLRTQSIGLSEDLASDEAFALQVIQALQPWLA